MVITKETAKPVQILTTVCTLLCDSAEAVGAGTNDSDSKQKIFEYADKVGNGYSR
jgi:hypothetical protein